MKFNFLIILITLCSACYSQLRPVNLAIVCNIDSPASVSIAHYYADARKIPQSHIIQLKLGRKDIESISPQRYVSEIAVPIAKKLGELNEIRCLVTTYGMPYKILPYSTAEKHTSELQAIIAIKENFQQQSLEIISSLAENTLKEPTAAYEYLAEKIEQAAHKDRKEQELFLKLIQPLYGSELITKLASVEFGIEEYMPDFADRNDSYITIQTAQKEQWDYAKCISNGYYKAYACLYGTLETINVCKAEIESINGINTDSCLDSELSLVRQPGCNLHGSIPNEYYQNLDAFSPENKTQTIMVSRLDGPSERLVKSIIDRAANVRESKGKCVFDLRDAAGQGLAKDYISFDQKLLDASELFAAANFTVHTDKSSKLTDLKSECLFYAGWYSPGRFDCNLTFTPRSLAYHISSYDGKDIRKRKGKLWGGRLLEAGACATITATSEPLLTAMPMPQLLAERLLAGDNIVEAFYFAKPQNSWQIMLIADPLMTIISQQLSVTNYRKL